jgi:Neuraminidase (sialidase)
LDVAKVDTVKRTIVRWVRQQEVQTTFHWGEQPIMTRRDFGPAPSRVADTPTYDGAVTQLIETNSGDLLLFYHQSDIGHTAPDGRIVLRRSTDRGETWTEPRIIHDESDRDVLGPSVVYDPDSGRVNLFDVAVGFSEPVVSPSDLRSLPSRENFDTLLVESTDHGNTWQEPRPITDRLDGERVIPSGGSTRTSERVITCFYTCDWVLQALISTDEGQT